MPNICSGCLPQKILPTGTIPRDDLKITYFPVNSKKPTSIKYPGCTYFSGKTW